MASWNDTLRKLGDLGASTFLKDAHCKNPCILERLRMTYASIAAVVQDFKPKLRHGNFLLSALDAKESSFVRAIFGHEGPVALR